MFKKRRTVLVRRLKEINITHISLVKAGANKKTIIYKSSDETPSYTREIKLSKKVNEKGVVYGIVYSPEEVDTQGDIASAEEIEKAAYSFMKGLNALNIDRDHNFKPAGAYVAESWILREGDPIFKDEKPGSWAVAIKLEDEELKEAVKKGEISGLSMAGIASREEVEKNDLSEVIKGLGAFFELFKGAGRTQKSEEPKKEEDKEQGSAKMIQALSEALKEVLSLKERIEALEANAKVSKQDTDKENDKKSAIKGVL